MKNKVILILIVFISTVVHSQIVDIPDANFKAALLNHDPDIDTNNDGQIQVSEAEIVTSINVWNKNISSLEGIQYFSLLSVLSCYDNQITTINLTNNPELRILECYNNNLLSLELSSNIELQLLHCSDNLITSLDLHQNINLQYLYCFRNLLTELNIGSNSHIKLISTSYNHLIDLDISQCPFLEFLFCYNNNLVNLNVQNNNNWILTSMYSYDNQNLMCIQVDDVENSENRGCDLPNSYGWCKDEWTEYSEECELGLEDNNPIIYTIYPNPTQDVLSIESQQPIEAIKIYSLQGQLIKQDSKSRVDVSQLSTGLYFVQVTIDGKLVTKKFIKE